jgi:predicted HAD superfamily Cof-like phosphohydrolase
MNLKNAQELVKQFQLAFGHPVADKPQMIDPERQKDRHNWLIEEANELLAAKTVVDVADAIGDVIYIALGTAIEHGIDIEPIFNIIQGANMAKLGPDGKPIYKEDGKVAKPEGWQPPEPQIEKEIERQANA